MARGTGGTWLVFGSRRDGSADLDSVELKVMMTTMNSGKNVDDGEVAFVMEEASSRVIAP